MVPPRRGRHLFTTRQIAAALLVCAGPFTAGAKPIGQFAFVVDAPGDQVDPSIDGEYVVYAGPGSGADGKDVFLHDLLANTTEIVGGGPGDQDSPDVNRDAAVYRTPDGIVIEFWQTNGISRAPPAGGDGPVSNPAIHTQAAAWEHHNGTDLDILVARYRRGSLPYVLGAAGGALPPGDQHAPSVFDHLVAYVDGALGGSVWLHDSTAGELDASQICAGRATAVSLGREGPGYVLAVARAAAGADEDIEVYDVAGNLLASLPAAGPQRNPHVAGDWVAFEDYSTAFSQVVLWRWKTPRGEAEVVFVPRPSETQQRLNDVTLLGTDEVRVVFEDSASATSGRDIGLYRLPVRPLLDDGQPSGWPIGGAPAAGCADPGAVVLATLELERAEGKPWRDSVELTADPPPGEDELPVLVCLHAEGVSSAWVTLGDDRVAGPSDFEPHVVDLTIPSELEGGRSRLSGAIAGEPGARLTVRVIVDPDGPCRDDDDDGDDGDDDGDHDGGGNHDGDHDDRDHDGDDSGDEHDGRGRDDGEHVRHASRREGPRCQRPAPPVVDPGGAPATSTAPEGGGCGNAGGLGSLVALAVLLARRKQRR